MACCRIRSTPTSGSATAGRSAACRSCASTGAGCCRASSGLTREQKREYGLGWLNWLGAESIGVVVALLNILWVPFVAFADIAVPDRILTVPILAAFAVSVAHFVALYRLRVRASPARCWAPCAPAMSVQWTVARAVGIGLVKERLPFLRTAKGGTTRKGPDFPAFWEAVIAGLLLAGAATLVVTNVQAGARDLHLRRGAGGAEPAVPVGGWHRRHRGHAASTRSPTGAASTPRRRVVAAAEAAIAEPPKLPAENRVEAAQ